MLRKKNRPWTEEEDRRLLDMVTRRRPRTSVAAALRRSVSAIAGRLRILRSRPKTTAADISESQKGVTPTEP
jgi:hypothetical protein